MVIMPDNWPVETQTVSSRAISELHEAEERLTKHREQHYCTSHETGAGKEILAERESSDRMTETDVK